MRKHPPAATRGRHSAADLFDLRPASMVGARQAMSQALRTMVAKWAGLPSLRDLYQRAATADPRTLFFERVIAELGVQVSVPPAQLARVPRTGPLVVVANHPFGAVEGMVLHALLARVRPDVKTLANHLLARVPEIRDAIIPVDPFDRPGSAGSNVAPIRAALAWLRAGGCLITFPAGEVAHFAWRTMAVEEPRWSPHVARLIRHTDAAALPVKFEGRNGAMFQILGLLNRQFRTFLLGQELLNKRSFHLSMTVGHPIAPATLRSAPNDEAASAILRDRTILLAGRLAAAPHITTAAPAAPLISAPPAARMSAEIARLTASDILVETPDTVVFAASAPRIPTTLREIGRLREATFRAVGEGTGRALDLDRFDDHYLHLVAWNRARQEVIGAYRLASTSTVLPRLGHAGLYTNTLFRFREPFTDRLGPAVELGRSFVRQDYQRSFNALMMLWKGIGAWLVRNPSHRRLFGPVSISSAYRPLARALMVAWLERHAFSTTLSPFVAARNPPRFDPRQQALVKTLAASASDQDELSRLVADADGQASGMPILLTHYLGLQGRVTAFNVDADFANAIDALIVIELDRVPTRKLERYLGREGAAMFAAPAR